MDLQKIPEFSPNFNQSLQSTSIDLKEKEIVYWKSCTQVRLKKFYNLNGAEYFAIVCYYSTSILGLREAELEKNI